MILSMSAQMALFGSTCLIGAVIGLLYDFLRLMRRLVRHSVLVINIEDGLYWLFVACAAFYFMLNRNYGEIRFFSIMGFFLGMVLYFMSISPVVLKIMSAAALFIKNAVAAAIKIIIYPVKVAINILKIPAGYILSVYGVFNTNSKKVLQKSERYARIKAKKLKNDLKVIVKKI